MKREVKRTREALGKLATLRRGRRPIWKKTKMDLKVSEAAISEGAGKAGS
jgi:hypothetical protein